MMGVCVLMPSDDKEDYFHLAQIRGLMGYRQSRPGVRWLLNQSVAVDDHVAHEQSMERVALDPDAALAHNGVPVLPEFCSSPMPAFTRTKTPDGNDARRVSLIRDRAQRAAYPRDGRGC